MFGVNNEDKIDDILEQTNFNKLYDKEKIAKEYRKYVQYQEYLQSEAYYYAYLAIVERCKKLFQELKIDSSTLASFTFEYLLKNGYFSKDQKLEYSLDGRVKNAYLYGADIMRGKSVCLNNACMLSDVLNNFGYQAYPVWGKTSSGDRRQDINHTVTLVKDDNGYYLADVTISDILKFNGFMKAKYTCQSKTIKIKPEYSLRFGYIAPSEFLDVVNNCYDGKKRSDLNHHNTVQIRKKAIKICKKNVKLLKDFYIENIGDINVVNETLVDDKVLVKKYVKGRRLAY